MRLVQVPSGGTYTFKPLSALGIIEVEDLIDKALSELLQSDNPRTKDVVVLIWSFAKAGGYTGTWQDFASEVDYQSDVPHLMDEVRAFFGADGSSEEATSPTSSAVASA